MHRKTILCLTMTPSESALGGLEQMYITRSTCPGYSCILIRHACQCTGVCVIMQAASGTQCDPQVL